MSLNLFNLRTIAWLRPNLTAVDFPAGLRTRQLWANPQESSASPAHPQPGIDSERLSVFDRYPKRQVLSKLVLIDDATPNLKNAKALVNARNNNSQAVS